MKKNEPIKADKETIEEVLFQYIVDINEAELGMEEARQLGEPSQEALARWTTRLDELDRQSKEQNRRRNWKRIIITAVVIGALMFMSAVAYTAHYWGLFLNVQEEFTQPRTAPGPEATVETWTDLPIPTDTPKGFFISDAASADGTSTIEYSNSGGSRFSIFYYSTESSVYIDSEKAEASYQMELENLTVYVLEKDGLTTLYWNFGPTIISIEFHPEEVSLDEITALALSMTLPI